jgi:hypothetical protein
VAFKHGYENIDLFVEEGTDRVPPDGRFYIVRGGVILEHHPNAKKALARLQALRFAANTRESTKPEDIAKSRMLQAGIVGRFMGEVTKSHHDSSTKKGGKGR